MINFSSLSAVMDTVTISKNGASSKIRMGRVNKKGFLGIAIACVAILFCVSFTSKSHVTSENATNQMIGVWKNVSGAVPVESIKIITKERFIWTWIHENKIVASASGTYTFDGETYIETIDFATENMSSLLGKKAVSKIRFEENKMYCSGTLNEVWERME